MVIVSTIRLLACNRIGLTSVSTFCWCSELKGAKIVDDLAAAINNQDREGQLEIFKTAELF